MATSSAKLLNTKSLYFSLKGAFVAALIPLLLLALLAYYVAYVDLSTSDVIVTFKAEAASGEIAHYELVEMVSSLFSILSVVGKTSAAGAIIVGALLYCLHCTGLWARTTRYLGMGA